MSTSTPTRPRVVPALGGTPRTPNRMQTPSASPQVKAAIAAMRLAKQQQSASRSATSEAHSTLTPASAPSTRSSTHHESPFETTMSPDGSARGGVPVSLDGTSEEENLDELRSENGWAVKSIKDMVRDARRSGRLNLSCRSLTSVPKSAYNTLIPLSSVYHSSTYVPPASSTPSPAPFSQEASVLFSPSQSHSYDIDASVFGAVEETEEGTDSSDEIEWTQLDLKLLNLSGNDLNILDEQLAGFEDLENLDVHSNLLTLLPKSMMLLTHLTSLNISSNQLVAFPVQLLALSSLISLDASNNAFSSLWAVGWQAELEVVRDSLGKLLGSPSRSPSSRNKVQYLINSSAPIKASASHNTAPFPQLVTLNLSGNPLGLTPSSIADQTFQWPSRLVSLNLSNTQMNDDGIALFPLGRLERLRELDLSGNALSFAVRSPRHSTGSPFSSLVKLNLAQNRIDLLRHLESFLLSSASSKLALTARTDTRRSRRQLVYTGVSKALANLIESCTALSERDEAQMILTIALDDNRLADEEQRRRQLYSQKKNGVESDSESDADDVSEAELEPQDVEKGVADISEDDVIVAEVKDVDGLLEGVENISISSVPAPGHGFELPPPPLTAEDVEPSTPVLLDETASPSTPSAPLTPLAPLFTLPATTPLDPRLLAFFYSRYSSSTRLLSLRSLDLSTLPSSFDDIASLVDPAEPFHSFSPPASPCKVNLGSPQKRTASSIIAGDQEGMESMTLAPTSIDGSKNEIHLFPLRSLVLLAWTTTLRRLDLSNNRISGLQTLVDGEGQRWRGVQLEGLAELNLRNNNLCDRIGLGKEFKRTMDDALKEDKDDVETVGIFGCIASFAPNLVSLDLSFNRLTTLADLALLLVPSHTDTAVPAELRVGSIVRKGLQSLHLAGNQIWDITGLVEVAELTKGRDAKSGAGLEAIGWRCDEIDLSANAIGRLPFGLGHLPLALSIPIAGNTFRIPSRDIWGSGGRVLMEWLRARVG